MITTRARQILPKHLHALWLLLQKQNQCSKVDFERIGREVFLVATADHISDLLADGSSLGLVINHGDDWVRTDEGTSFAQSDHWRLWDVPECLMDKFHLANVHSFFLNQAGMSSRPIVFDLFSGAGGLGYGFEAEGFDVRLSLDNDPQACEAALKNFPNSRVLEEDISDAASDPITNLCDAIGVSAGNVAGIIGGPPCQGFSNIGERVTTDSRNLLSSYFMDIVLKIEPSFFVIENVEGLLTSGAPPDFPTYISRNAKSIGSKATDIATGLESLARGKAKREPQFRRRIVSKAIKGFEEGIEPLQEGFTDPCLASTLGLAQERLLEKLTLTLNEELAPVVEGEVEKVLSDNGAALARLTLCGVIGKAMRMKALKRSEVRPLFERLCSAEDLSPAILGEARQLIDEYDQLPSRQTLDDQSVGPVLWELIQRASKKYAITTPKILNSASYGAPQKRRRLFVVGIRKSLSKKFSFPSPTHRPAGETESESNGSTVEGSTTQEAIGDLPDVDQYPFLMNDHTLLAGDLLPSQSTLMSSLRLERMDADEFCLPRDSWNPFLVDCSTATHHHKDVVKRLRETGEGQFEATSHRTRLNRNRASHTLRAGTREGKGSHTAVRPIHYEYPRVITVREGARIMGYPDWMTFHPTKWHGFRLVGNGVPGPLGRAIARQIRNSLFPSLLAQLRGSCLCGTTDVPPVMPPGRHSDQAFGDIPEGAIVEI